MKLRKLFQFCMICAVASVAIPAEAQQTISGVPPLHVDGQNFKDEQGNKVVLHGVMDTPNDYFNGYRWGWGCNDNNVSACISYFDKLFTAITNHDSGAYCNIFRLHLDPAWTNGNNNAWPRDDREKYYDDWGTQKENTGEADFSKYTGSRLDKYMNSLYIPIAQKAIKNKMYVIMRPPGVCPHDIYVGGSYQKFLLDVWGRVSKHSLIQKYCGQIMIELANEPINVKMANGSDSEKALHDFFQPIVDKIRENGFKGIILIPGTGYQSNYRNYIKYPITGDNIGYAVHNYAGWYDNSDDHCDVNNAIKKFGESVPIIRTNPIVITEVDWSPKNTSEIDHYNEFNQPVYKNYGTWATASTSKWGKAYKAILDYYGNVSMTLTGTGDYIDIDSYINNKKVVPAFKTKMEKNGVDPYEACGVACFDWYEKYYQVNYASAERYQPKQEVPENPFAFKTDWFIPTICGEGTATLTDISSILNLKNAGFSGWRFEEEEGLNLSKYDSLKIVMAKKLTSAGVTFRIYDSSNYWDEYYEFPLEKNVKEMRINLKDMKTASGKKIDPSHIRIAGFTTTLSNGQAVYLKEIELVADPTAINTLEVDASAGEEGFIDLMGRPVAHPSHGIFIRRGDRKKIFIP
ncbi:MAG: cellulase family glycosylhydrolase [Bacteroidaceae bacterium]|nr:cellulase family glycosylhydrolase [Bacteroidaceae bacterium]